MHVEDAIRHRRSIRRFLPDPVPTTTIREMLTLASLSPCVGNRQMWRYIVVTEPPLRQMLARTVERQLDAMETWPELANELQRLRVWRESSLFFADAPVVIFVIHTGYRIPFDAAMTAHGVKFYEVHDLLGYPDVQSIAGMIAYLTLLAEDRGLGSCWLTNLLVDQKDLHAVLELKTGEKIMAAVALGKPADFPIPKPRKAIDELIDWR